MSLQRLTRVFKKATTRLLDPDPAMSPEQVMEHYTDLYPELANATVSEPETVGNELVYTFEKPMVKTKGQMSVSPAKVTVVKVDGNGMASASYKDELHAALEIIENGSLGSRYGFGGWGSAEHRKAVADVAAKVEDMRARFARDDAIAAAPTITCEDCGGDIAVGFEDRHSCGD